MSDESLSEKSTFAHISRGAAVTLVGKVLGALLGFTSSLFITRSFGSGTFGGLRFALSLMTIVSILSIVGVSSGVQRFVATADSDSDAISYYFLSMGVGFVSSIIVGSVTFFSADSISIFFFGNDDPGIFLRFVGISLPFVALYKISLSATRGWNYSSPNTLIRDIAVKLIKFITFGGVVYFGLSQTSIAISLLVIYGSVFLLSILATAYVIRRQIDDPWRVIRSVKFDIEKLHVLLSFSIPLVFTKGVWFLMNNADTLMIGYFSDESAVGLYAAAFSLAVFVRMVLGASGALFMPNLAKLYENDQLTDLQSVYRRTTKWMIVLSLPVMIGNLGFPDVLLSLFRQEFVSASLTLGVLSVGVFSHVLFGLNSGALKSIDRPRILLYNNILVLVLNLILNVILIPRFGILGGAVATSVSYILLNILHGFVLYRDIRLVPVRLDFLGLTLVWLAVIVGAAQTLGAGITTLPAALVFGAIGFCLYVGTAWRLGYVSTSEFNGLIS